MNATTIAAGYLVFIVAAGLPVLLGRTGLSSFFDDHPTMPHFVVKTVLLIFSLTAIQFARKSWAEFGFRRPKGFRFLPAAATGAALGALATAFILLTPAQGMPNLRNFGFLGLVLSIWIYSSVTEELFVRGWLQSSLDTSNHAGLRPVLVSAVFFGSMHLTLIPAGGDWITVVVIVTFTTLLGFQTARLRQAHGSLLPPIVAHVAFNVGGLAAGIVLNIIAIARTGSPLVP